MNVDLNVTIQSLTNFIEAAHLQYVSITGN